MSSRPNMKSGVRIQATKYLLTPQGALPGACNDDKHLWQALTASPWHRGEHEGWCMLEDMCSCLSKSLQDRGQSHGPCHSSGCRTQLPCCRASTAAVLPAIQQKMMCIQCKEHCEESVKRDVSLSPMKVISEQQLWCLLQHLCSPFSMTTPCLPRWVLRLCWNCAATLPGFLFSCQLPAAG